MPHIFISYKNTSPDLSYRDELIEYLSTIGYTVDNGKLWYDKTGLDLGDEWFSEIRTALDDAFAIIVIITKNSTRAAWVNFEFAYAASQGIPILGLLFGDKVNIVKLPISHFQVKKWQEIQNTLPEIIKKYDGEFSLSKLTGLAIWRVFEPITVYTRFFLWMNNQPFGDIHLVFMSNTLIMQEVSRITNEMLNFWLAYSHAFTRRQKKDFVRFRAICHEIPEELIAYHRCSTPEEAKEPLKRIEALLGELYTGEVGFSELLRHSRLAAYFELKNDFFFEMFPEHKGIKNVYLARKKATGDLALTDDNNFIGKNLREIIPENIIQQIDAIAHAILEINKIE